MKCLPMSLQAFE
uniref:Uncharacterized protein n=1 Tax=Anguilla anguilla TaxID=7936 RepID=A0A0E9VI09_ANGAN